MNIRAGKFRKWVIFLGMGGMVWWVWPVKYGMGGIDDRERTYDTFKIEMIPSDQKFTNVAVSWRTYIFDHSIHETVRILREKGFERAEGANFPVSWNEKKFMEFLGKVPKAEILSTFSIGGSLSPERPGEHNSLIESGFYEWSEGRHQFLGRGGQKTIYQTYFAGKKGEEKPAETRFVGRIGILETVFISHGESPIGADKGMKRSILCQGIDFEVQFPAGGDDAYFWVGEYHDLRKGRKSFVTLLKIQK